MACSKKYLHVLIICTLFSLAGKGQNLQLEIQGKDSLETAVIDSLGYVRNHVSYSDLSQEIDSVFQLVQKIGFVDAEVFPPKKINDSLYTVVFFLRKKYRWLKVHYETLPLETKTLKNLTTELRPNHFVVPFGNIEDVLNFLNQQIANRGQPFSYLQLEAIQKGKSDTLTAHLKAVSSKTRKIDEIIVKGYEKFPVSYLKHFIDVQTGQVFNKQALEKKMQRLQNLPFASSINPPEVQFTKDSTAVYLYLEKEKSNAFDGFLGFSNNEENGKLRLTGNIDLTLLNNLNYGESLSLHYRSDGNEQTRFQATINLPYLFQTPLGLGLGLDIFKKDSSYVTTDQNVRLNYQLSPRIKVFANYRFSESNNLLEASERTSGGTIDDYSTNFFNIGVNYKNFNKFNALFPIKTFAETTMGYGTRENAGNSTQQYSGNLKAGNIFRFNQRNSLFFQNESAVLFSDYYLVNELFLIGGINSIRGFAENSIPASLLSVTQTEYRYQLSSNLYVHSIIDYAYYENKILEIRENLYGLGFGFGLKTNAGILHLNFANGKADGQKFEFSNTKIHLSLSTYF